jgi:hypothetical protein
MYVPYTNASVRPVVMLLLDGDSVIPDRVVVQVYQIDLTHLEVSPRVDGRTTFMLWTGGIYRRFDSGVLLNTASAYYDPSSSRRLVAT